MGSHSDACLASAGLGSHIQALDQEGYGQRPASEFLRPLSPPTRPNGAFLDLPGSPRPCDTSPTAGGRVLPSAQSPLTGSGKSTNQRSRQDVGLPTLDVVKIARRQRLCCRNTNSC